MSDTILPVSEIQPNIDEDKQHIISMFENNVKHREIHTEGYHNDHCGKEGHWLESKMGITPNAKNAPDLRGFECKKTSKKTTLGDYSASEYLFSKKKDNINQYNGWSNEIIMSRNEYITTFGNPNPKKNNRYSWSGSCVPTYDTYNSNGTVLTVSATNDLIVYYSFSKDTRNNKHNFPEYLQHDNIVIAIWLADKLRTHINNKFNQRGFFICTKENNVYEKICFGKPFNFDYFIECIKNKTIIFDSGMYQGNSRNYSMFRGASFWKDLIIEEY